MEQPQFKVQVFCMTFNHAPYILETMNGFCLQQTMFPFICTIFDDCSTDGEQEVIRQYIQEHFEKDDNIVRKEETDDYILTYARHKTNKNCFFAVYYLKYNHYSIGKGYRKQEYCKEFTDEVHYIALCEGDDYWINPDKFQKQVDYLESHPDCTMVCNRSKRYSEKDQCFIADSFCLAGNGYLDKKDVIKKGGLYISTCSIVYKKQITDNYPEYCKRCHVGDYPLQIMAAMKGSIYYFNVPMSVYRVNNPLSWVGKTATDIIKESYLKGTRTEVDMLKGFSLDYSDYKKVFSQRIAYYITSIIIYKYRNDTNSVNLIKTEFDDEITRMGWIWKMRVFFILHHCYGLRKIYSFFYSFYLKYIFN